MKKVYLFFLAMFFYGVVFAQDKIYKKDGEVIEAKVTEIGSDELKYKIFNDQNGPTYSLEKDLILKVVYENGRIESYQSNLKDPALYADQAKNAIKINFLSPLLGYTQLNYEHNLRPGRGYEISLGLIGLGKRQKLNSYFNGAETFTQNYRGASGLYLGAGYKFSKVPDFVNKGAKYSHVLQGTYIKPELSIGVYGQNHFEGDANGNPVKSRESLVFGGLLVNLGKQWVLGDALLVDIYGGLGYALDSRSDDYDGTYYNETIGNHFALSTGNDSGLGATGGFKVGLLLNKKK